jgi:phosphoribosylpyrophosphate synthetase
VRTRSAHLGRLSGRKLNIELPESAGGHDIFFLQSTYPTVDENLFEIFPVG